MDTNFNFSTEFWNKTHGNFSGHLILLEKLHVSTTVNEQYSEFLRNISTSFLTFSKSLAKISKVNPMSGETGELLKIGETLQNFVKLTNEKIKVTSSILLTLSENSSRMATKLDKKRKEMRENLRDSKTNVVDAVKRLNNYQRETEHRHKEKIEVQSQHYALKDDADAKAKDLEKSNLSVKKNSEQFEAMENTYRKYVGSYNKCIDQYIAKASKEFENVQGVELIRGYEMTESLKKFCSAFKSLGTDMHKISSEFSNLSSTSYNVEHDLMWWTEKNRTGQTQPVHFHYKPTGMP